MESENSAKHPAISEMRLQRGAHQGNQRRLSHGFLLRHTESAAGAPDGALRRIPRQAIERSQAYNRITASDHYPISVTIAIA